MPGIGQKSDFPADGEENTFLRTGKKSAYLQAETTEPERSGRNPDPGNPCRIARSQPKLYTNKVSELMANKLQR